MSGQTLTSLRTAPLVPPESTYNSPFEREQVQLGELRGEIVLLTRERDNLKEEVEKLNRATEFTKDRLKSDTEVKRLKIQKSGLLKQINSLTSTLSIFQDHKLKVARGLERFGEDHIAFLNSISHALQLDVRSVTATLSEKSAKIATEEQFLEGLADYLAEYARICEAGRSQNALGRQEIEKATNEMSQAKEKTSLLLNRAQSKLSDTDARLKQATERLRKADLITTVLEKKNDSEREHLEKLSLELSFKEKAVFAERMGFSKREELLRKKERKLSDKEETLKRAYAEIKAKAKRIGIVL